MSHDDHRHDGESVERRLAAVERAVSTGEPIERTDRIDELEARIDELEARIDELEARIDELEAAVQALRGYVGSVRAVNDDIERRADRALRTAKAVERNVAPADSVDPEPASEPETDDERRRSTPIRRLRERL